MQNAAARLRDAIREATDGLIERDHLAELLILAAVAQEHLLVIGRPGTAKSAVVRRVAQSLGGNYFEYLLCRFTEPSELFGPVNFAPLIFPTLKKGGLKRRAGAVAHIGVRREHCRGFSVPA